MRENQSAGIRAGDQINGTCIQNARLTGHRRPGCNGKLTAQIHEEDPRSKWASGTLAARMLTETECHVHAGLPNSEAEPCEG